ncbi:hypothetical protein PUNSTDRAFT_53598 [Punctularia strigosozonata HHB-11173 SS5]|uniref:uncharacterized protein n=1 Tax=Punctularia strigosozonata (strain HHB-11173) TaxID=741275 RepID=UPI00044185EC|nr:uncharacterized protein PUNSTDRAFT_53598 [Punctularia strigosozonata HHB-11173 SS5]EIN07222.1 hypothetical protein PUNSTDRAFT_53598 [Punctularia strigosozonata HHB-11173 SS5]
MSYRNPYETNYGAGGSRPYGENNAYGENSYSYNNYEPHRTYDQGFDPYRDAGGYRDEPSGLDQSGYVGNAPAKKETSVFEKDEPFSAPRSTSVRRKGSRSAATIRTWRYEHQESNMWTAGSRGRCFGRFLCCSLMTFVFLLVSIVLALALWVRPPSVTIGQLSTITNGSAIQLSSDGLTVNLNVNISVDNPNFFSVAFKKINVDLHYPINNTDVGGGSKKNIDFEAHSNKTFDFPISLEYTLADDPNSAILADLATKCGFIGGSKSDITVDYDITLGLRILFITVSPQISNSFSFACPLDESDLSGLLKDAGIDISSLSSILGSS